MRKRVLAIFPLLTVIMVFVGLWIADQLITPAWRSELNQYLVAKTHPPAALPVLERAVQASHPWNFREEMGGATYGDCYYFSVMYCYHSAQTLPSGPVPVPPSQPRPYLPGDLWCALVQLNVNGVQQPWVVYVARYQDLYNAGWIVQESSHNPSDPLLAEDLAALGCSALISASR